MFRLTLLVIAVALMLSAIVACAPAATPTPVPPTAAPAKPASTIAPGTTSAPAAASAPSSALKVDPKATDVLYTFKVVPDESEVGYAVQELFFGRPAPQTTIGKTKVVDGQFTAGLRDGKVFFQSSQFKADLRTLKSDESRRDEAIRRFWLESNKYPFAEFTSTAVEGLPPELKEGVETFFKVAGNMTIRNTTKPLTFDAKATLNGDTLTGIGTTFLLMKDFGFDAPDIAGQLKVTDGVTVTVKGVAKLSEVKK